MEAAEADSNWVLAPEAEEAAEAAAAVAVAVEDGVGYWKKNGFR